MKDIEDRLKEEYDKVEVPEYMFDTSRTFKRVRKEKNNTKKIIIASVASIVVILLVFLVVIFVTKDNKNENIDTQTKAESYEVNIADKIILNYNNGNAVDVKHKGLYVQLIKTKKIVAYEIIDDIPYAKIKANVQKNYLGDTSSEIEIYVPGGIFKVKDIKEKVKIKDEDLIQLSKYNDEDYLKVIYYNEIFIPEVEEEKTYITTLKEIDGKYFVYMNSKYGFKEYDPETNIVKDDMGDEQLDIDRYLESINI